MIKKINVTCEKCKESFIFTSESSLVDKVLDEGHYICFTCEDKLSVEKLQEQLQRFAEENERLRNALEDIRTNTPIQELLNLPYSCACHEIASEALAEIGEVIE